MDFFILLGAGLLGAMFVSSQSETRQPSILWKILFGGGGGALVFSVMEWRDIIPLDSSISTFLLLFVLGGFAGGLAILVFLLLRSLLEKR